MKTAPVTYTTALAITADERARVDSLIEERDALADDAAAKAAVITEQNQRILDLMAQLSSVTPPAPTPEPQQPQTGERLTVFGRELRTKTGATVWWRGIECLCDGGHWQWWCHRVGDAYGNSLTNDVLKTYGQTHTDRGASVKQLFAVESAQALADLGASPY